MGRKKKICVKQHDAKDCGAACLSTIAKTYNLNLQISKIRDIAGTDSYGTSAYGLVRAAERLGFTAKSIKGTREDLFKDFPKPAIANVLTKDGLQHYVVIHEVKNNHLIIADPAKGLEKMKFDDFTAMWTGVLIVMTPTYQFEEGNEQKGTFTRFFQMLVPQKKLILNVFLMSLVLTIFGIIGSFYFQFIMDDIIPGGLTKTLHVVSLAFVGLYLLRVILSALRSHLMMYLGVRLDLPMMMGYYKHITKLPMKFYSTRQIGEITSRFEDAGIIQEAVSGATLTIMLDSIMLIAGGAILYTIDPTMFLMSVIIAALYGVLVYAFIKPFKRIQRESMEQGAKVSSYLIESIQGTETIKACNAEDEAGIETEIRYVKNTRLGMKGSILGNIQGSLIGIVEALGGLFILWFGAYQVIKGNLTLGQLLTFNALLGYFMDPLKNFIGLQQNIQQAIVASDRLSEIIDLELELNEEEEKKHRITSMTGDIELKGVNFRYGSRRLTLKDINLSIKSGEKVAIVGESGSGKTTLAKLLMNFYDIEKGSIEMDSYDISSINKESLRNRVGYVPQDVFIFSGTVEKNLHLGMKDRNYDDMVKVCKDLKVHDFITDLPKNYQSELIEGGANLSGGQRQRLAIARALVRKPDVLILDEATSNLDAKTEAAITEILASKYKKLTTVIIAHRLSTIRKCDKIVVMDDGVIKEVGSHKKLLDKKGYYYDLWTSQVGEGV